MISLIKLLHILSSKFIIIFEGEWGVGKTLSMVSYAYMMSVYSDIHNIISKNPVFYPDLKDRNYSALVQTSQFEGLQRDTLILHDELLDDIDRRNSLSPINKYLTRFAKAYRKLHIQEVGTVQYISMIDERLLEMMQILITPKWRKKYHKDSNIDSQIRKEKNDYRMYWYVTDLKENRQYSIIIDVSKFLNCYDTRYIPNKLAVTHNDYLEWFKLSQTKNKNDLLESINNEIIHSSNKEWSEGMDFLKRRFTHENL